MLPVSRHTGRMACAMLAVVLAFGLAACGSATHHAKTVAHREAPWGDVVVRMGADTITAPALERWIRLEAILTHEYDPRHPLPAGIVPVPPAYTACISYLAAIAKREHVTPAPTPAKLKAQCAEQHKHLQEHTLEILITDYWFAKEAAAKGLTVSTAEVQRTLKREFPTPAKLQAFLKITGAPASYERFLVLSGLFEGKLHEYTWGAHGQTAELRDAAIEKLRNELLAKWPSQTSCRPGYVIWQCKQYTGPERV